MRRGTRARSQQPLWPKGSGSQRLGSTKSLKRKVFLRKPGGPNPRLRLRWHYLRGWQDVDSESAVLSIEVESPLVEELAERGVRGLLDELEKMRSELAEYRERYGPLD